MRDCSDPNNIYLPPTATDTSARLNDLRQQMRQKNYDAYIVPSEDEHLGEYIPTRDKKRVWITGFTGSSGTAVVTLDKAAVWTDGRYFLQAEQQLDCNWILMRTGEPNVPSIEEWISEQLSAGSVSAAYPFVFSIDGWLQTSSYLEKSQIFFNQSITDVIDLIWADRPPADGDRIVIYPVEYAGKPWEEKISEIRTEMSEAGADYLFLTSRDENAWLFNLRGNDLSNIPVYSSYARIGMNDIILYANTTLLNTAELHEYFEASGCVEASTCVTTAETTEAYNDLLILPSSSIVWMSSEGTTYGMYSAVDPKRQIRNVSPVKMAMSVKNPVEINGMKQAHIYDAVALCEYIKWLEETVPKETVTELSGAEKLKSLRLAQDKSKGLSFTSISAVGPNAAVIHYRASEETNTALTTNEIYLIDSGGQYYEGTTDVTRTMHFGTPTAFEKEAFTRVLLANSDIEMAIFPETLDGNDIDILGRRHLYDVGLNFRHGTGHGIGHYLNIHEYPPAIGRAQAEGYPFKPGMFTSNEPGYYEDGEFGIRLENIVVVEEANTKYDFGDYRYLTLTSITLVPFQKKMIDITLMNDKQLNHVNAYHARVMDVVGAELLTQGKNEVHQWLSDATSPMERSFGRRQTASYFIVALSLFCSVVMKL